jgi:hypothetical protein
VAVSGLAKDRHLAQPPAPVAGGHGPPGPLRDLTNPARIGTGIATFTSLPRQPVAGPAESKAGNANYQGYLRNVLSERGHAAPTGLWINTTAGLSRPGYRASRRLSRLSLRRPAPNAQSRRPLGGATGELPLEIAPAPLPACS